MDPVPEVRRVLFLIFVWACVQGRVLIGAFPGLLDDKLNDRNLRLLLRCGVDTFVCLQAEVDRHVPERIWRKGDRDRGLRPYILDVERLSPKQVLWRHMPIDDCDVAEDEVVGALVDTLMQDLRDGRVMYVHCWGGHGRAGTVARFVCSVARAV